jgi:lambda repressor-like predicted transcriptional regulator
MAEKTLLQKRFEQSLRARGLSILAAHHQSGLSRTTLNRIRDGELVQEDRKAHV